MVEERQDGMATGKLQVVPNGVSGPETNPLGNGAVLLLRLGELLLCPERLVALCFRNILVSFGVFDLEVEWESSEIPNSHGGAVAFLQYDHFSREKT